MVINGVDYTIYLIAGGSFALMALAEYFICLKSKNPSARKVLLFVPFLILVAGLLVYGSNSGGGFLDLSGLVLVVATIYALLCGAGMFAGWFAFKLKYENKNELPESCPFSEE
ncbi:MAG: hypothetical protein IJ410_07100 [Oscillospiraceae bacterium]|nr:hypothetical protein [Oscillospiraceae bacterium]